MTRKTAYILALILCASWIQAETIGLFTLDHATIKFSDENVEFKGWGAGASTWTFHDNNLFTGLSFGRAEVSEGICDPLGCVDATLSATAISAEIGVEWGTFTPFAGISYVWSELSTPLDDGSFKVSDNDWHAGIGIILQSNRSLWRLLFEGLRDSETHTLGIAAVLPIADPWRVVLGGSTNIGGDAEVFSLSIGIGRTF